jgi:hypothetical protein
MVFAKANTPVEFREVHEEPSLLEQKISQLALRIEGTLLELRIRQLYSELEAKGLRLFPRCYLSDEWGCPEGIPVIGIPFYLASPMLGKIEEDVTGDLESEPEIVRYLRHEAGHAYNYAYRLHERQEWHNVFGPYTRPYLEEYHPAPFSKKFVRHLPGWYAQKHPDEDFAETFAVWLTPGLDWRAQYKGWAALNKLEYLDATLKSLPEQPVVSVASVDGLLPVEEMNYTVREHYQRQEKPDLSAELGQLLDGDLRDLCTGGEGDDPLPTWLKHRKSQLVREITYWTGARPQVVRALLDHLATRAQILGLSVRKEDEKVILTRFCIMITTLIMNHVYRDRFIEF